MDEHHIPDKQLVHLIVVSGPDKGKMFFLKPRKEALIGRHSTADLRLTDPGASSKHCLVRSAGDMVFIDDLKSRNGTRVNGEPVTTRVLDDNGRIEIGTSVIEVRWVATEREVPLGAVQSDFAPTVYERGHGLGIVAHKDTIGGSTIVGAHQLQELRAAQALLGNFVASYMLLEVIGYGPMGFVFRAKDVKSKEEVALKVIPRALARAEALLEKFLQECQIGLLVPGAAQVLATGMTDQEAYVAMELVRGRGLQAIVEGGRKFSAADAVAIVSAVCETLKKAHAQGVIHRDLKPANIALPEDDPPVLLDLGIAKKTEAEGKFILKRGDRQDSIAYSSPEATREAGDVDARADVYSLGAVLYFLLSGHRPFSAKSQIELVRKVRWESAPFLADARPDVPPLLAAVVALAMEKESARRYANMDELGDALKRAMRG